MSDHVNHREPEVRAGYDAKAAECGMTERERSDRLEEMIDRMAAREVAALELHGSEPGLQSRDFCRTCHVPRPCPTYKALTEPYQVDVVS